MEKDLEAYYNDFRRPPFAPTYHPTEEEFADPISYVAKIKPEAQQFGLIKIIPPPSFRPPFCIDPAKFEFVPRVQRLNEIDALFRLRIIYINKLVHFWKFSKDQQFRIPYIDNKYIDLYRLCQLVDGEGGLKRVNDARRWAHIAKALGFRGNAGQTMRQCYTRWIHPFELSVANKEQQQQHHHQDASSRSNSNNSSSSRSPKKRGAAAGRRGGCVAAAASRRRCRHRRSTPPPPSKQHGDESNDSSSTTTGVVSSSMAMPSSSNSSSSMAMPSSSNSSSSMAMPSSSNSSSSMAMPSSSGSPSMSVPSETTPATTPKCVGQAAAGNDDDDMASATPTKTADESGAATVVVVPVPTEQYKDGLEAEDDEEEDEEEEDEDMSMPPLTRSQARMMAGSAKTAVPSLDKSSIQAGHRTTPIELVMCGECGSGDDEARLLLCETCDASMHTYCATPPLTTVPKGEWRCAQCVAHAVRSVSMDFGFTDSNQCFTLETFGEWANNFKQQYFNQEEPREVSQERVECEFWRNVIDIDKGVQVKYGADLISSKVGSGFPRRGDNNAAGGGGRGGSGGGNGTAADARERHLYASHPWNLNNLPKVRESVLCHMNTDISGMIVPWVYIGMLFSTFCWHVEDHWLYSINYNHWGERKIWYGVPGEEAELFDKVVKESAPELFAENKDLLHQMITHINPQFLIERGIHVYTVHQNAGEFVITFPRSYHAGFNEGLNCAEAVNFAPPDWLKMGRLCLENYASVGRTCVFSHEELVMKMVFVAHKMSIAMCLATLDELSWIVARETDFRQRLSVAGVRANALCRFEDIPDDERSCAVCRTTLYCSALCCRHAGRMVCTQHVQQLCNECSMDECCLKYRYTLDDLVPLVHRLTERTTAFFEWRSAVAELYAAKTRGVTTSEAVKMEEEAEAETTQADEDGGERRQRKIDVTKLRLLADQWRIARFPHCEEIQRLNQAIGQFERTTIAVRKVLKRKIRLRDQTRCQKADTRWEYAEVHNLRQQLADSMFEDRELEEGIQDLCRRVERWKMCAIAALERPFAGAQTVSELCALVTEAAEEFNVKLEAEGLDRLKSELARCQWLVNANKIVRRHHHQTTTTMVVVKKSEEDGEVGGEGRHGNGAVAVDEPQQPLEQLEDDDDEDGDGDEGEEGEQQKQRVELHVLAKTVADGLKWCSSSSAVQQLNAKLEHLLNCANAIDRRAADFLALARGGKQKQQQKQPLPTANTTTQSSAGTNGTASTTTGAALVAAVGFEQARQKWEAIAAAAAATAPENGANGGEGQDVQQQAPPMCSNNNMAWFQSPAIDCFRVELELAQKVCDDFELLNKKAFSLRSLEQLEHNFAQSLFERDGQRHAKLKVWLDGLQHFVERIRTLFQHTACSYYTLFDIVAGRSDLPALIEGESMPLTLFTSTKYADNWRPLRSFVSRDQLVAHLQSIGDQQCTLLHALRLTNAHRSPKETCCCARDTPPPSLAASSSASASQGGRRQRLLQLNCLTPSVSSSSTSSCGSGRRTTTTNGGSRQQQRGKRSSLPSRTTATTSAFDDASLPPTMVVDGRRRTTLSSSTTTTPAAPSEVGQQQQQQMDTTDTNGQQHTDVVVVEHRRKIAANELIPCFVCNANLHVVCVQWDPFFDRLPPGVLLCQRCLRSRRPCIEEVEEACRSSELPENCLEKIVVQNLFNRSVNIFTRLQRLLHTIPKGTSEIEPNVEAALKKWLTMALSLEITDTEVYTVLCNASAYFELFPLPERQIQIWHHVRERRMGGDAAQPLPIIFGQHSICQQQSSASGTNGGGSGAAGGSGRRSANAGGGKRRSGGGGGTAQQQQQLRHSLSAVLNLTTTASCCSSASPAKQQRRHHHQDHHVQQQQQHQERQHESDDKGISNSTTANMDNKDDDDLAMTLMMVDEQDGDDAVMKHEEVDNQMEHDDEAGGSDQHDHQQQLGDGGAHMEKCAADFCLRPYSEFTRWIQCEAGCARWYHFCCVGISVRGVQHISAYCCYKCATTAAASSSSSRSARTTATAASTATAAAAVATVAALSSVVMVADEEHDDGEEAATTTTVTVIANKLEQHSPPPPPHRSPPPPTATATTV